MNSELKKTVENPYLPNNFDLLRLFAALHVMLANHYNIYFNMEVTPSFLHAFSGVPIFLFLTGMFIPMSFEHNGNVGQFLTNRCLKIFPEMWVSIILGVALMFAAGYRFESSAFSFLAWLASYMVYPLHTPAYLREYGVGAINGALWIIPVQLCFYLLIPILYKFFSFSKNASAKIILLFFAFVLTGLGVKFALEAAGFGSGSALYKIYSSSILVNFPMLLFGMFAYKNFRLLKRITENKFLLFLALHMALFYGFKFLGLESSCLASSPSWTKWPLMVTLCLTVLSAGYTLPNLSKKILGKYDLSYSLYVYHMPIANFVIFTCGSDWRCGVLAAIACLFVSVLSKHFIETPILKLKKNPLRRA